MKFGQLFANPKTVLGSLIPLLFVVIFGSVNYYGLATLQSTAEWVEHTHKVITSATEIEKLIIDLETGERGFLITGKEQFLEPYEAAKGLVAEQIRTLQQLVSDNPEQVEHAGRIGGLVVEWQELAGEPVIAARKRVRAGAKSAETLQQLLGEGVGKAILDDIRRLLNDMNGQFERAGNQQAVNLVLTIAKAMVDMETGERGFLITGKAEFLVPYQAGHAALGGHIDRLNGIIDRAYDREPMRKDIATLAVLAGEWQQQAAQPEIALRRQVNRGARSRGDIEQALSQKRGKGILDRIRTLLAGMNARFVMADNQAGQNLLLAIAKDLVDRETGQRGFLITGREEFLEPYVAGGLALETHLEQIAELVGRTFNPNALRRSLNKVEALAGEWHDKAAGPEIAIREEINQNPASLKEVIRLIEAETGKEVMDRIRAELALFKQDEQELLALRQADAGTTSTLALWFVGLGTLVIVFFAVALQRSGAVLKRSTLELKQERRKLEEQDWVKTNYATITGQLQGLRSLPSFAETLMNELVPSLDAHLGLFYTPEESTEGELALSLLGSYAYRKRKNVSNRFALGEGLVGQCALERKGILLTEVPDDYVQISSGSGTTPPKNINVFPIEFENRLLAVIEVASVKAFSPQHLELIQHLEQNVGVIINNIISRIRTEELLQRTQAQTEELEAQQEELRVANDDLEAQAQRLKASEEELKQQGEELRVSNEELEERQEALGQQKAALELANDEIEKKAEGLAQASKYKTEFLSNMSHELRTPLNSLLILSRSLAENREQNLTPRQQEDAQVIYEGGNDLLALINDIMDLSKVEAGMLDIHADDVALDDLSKNIEKLFGRVATEKGIGFDIVRQEDLPASIKSDGQRLEQILKNFLSNAFKFTQTGSVTFRMHRPEAEVSFTEMDLAADSCIALAVIDTGVGISEEKQQDIFEAFQQEDGSTSRKYGGTGLGLAISKELTRLLGGKITLNSVKGEGSTFTLYLPIGGAAHVEIPASEPAAEIESTARQPTPSTPAESRAPTPKLSESFIADDRREIYDDDHSILIIEDDARFASVLMSIAHKGNFKCLAADKGRHGLYLAEEYQPRGILLDLGLPDIDGLKVLEQLKYNLKTRHIPVHVISGKGHKQASLQQGALSYLAKPAKEEAIASLLSHIEQQNSDSTKAVLVVDDDAANRQAIERLIQAQGIRLVFAATGSQALEAFKAERFDCVILDLGLPDINGFEVLKQITDLSDLQKPPVIVYTGREISDEEQLTLNRFASDIIIKGAESPERLLDDVSLFLHSVEAKLPEDQKKTIRMLHDEDSMLKGRKILLVDDDMRNVFALSRQLEDVGLRVVMADNGRSALEKLQRVEGSGKVDSDPFALIIMDIMMPVMDGYEAMVKVRQLPRYADIPIIALTAKAMPEDRAKCIAAGASEYLTKPVDLDKLLSMLRVWLYRHATA